MSGALSGAMSAGGDLPVMRVIIELAGPPRGKGRPRATVTRQGFTRVYTDERTAKYETQLRYVAAQEMASRPPTIQPVRVVMTVRFAIPDSWSQKKRAAALAGHVRPTVAPDADNSLKLCDALNKIVWSDDKQVVEATVRKIYSDMPGLSIIVETIEPPTLPASGLRVANAAGDLFAGVAG